MDSQDYELVAKYYDGSYNLKPDLNDLPFYLEIAKQQGGPVLEIACGTGRVLVEIAKLGITIEGVDFSQKMLSILREKLHKESENVRQRVTLHIGDMRTFWLEKQFRLVTIPFRSLQHMYTIEDQVKALKRTKDHLQPKDGLLVFNVFYPDYTLLDKEVMDSEWIDPSNPNRILRRYFIRYKVNKLYQYFEGAFIYKTYENSKIIKEEKTPIKMGYYTYPHMQLLFEHCGLEILKEYGSFSKDPIDICQEMIFILRRKD